MDIQFAPKEFELDGNNIKHNHCVYMIPFTIPVYFVFGEGHLFGNNVPLKDMESFWCKYYINRFESNFYQRKQFYCYSKDDFRKVISYMNGDYDNFEEYKAQYIPE